MSDTALTTADLAKLLSTAPKTLRAFLRSRSSGVGSGARYSFTQADVADLSAEFEVWANAKTPRKRSVGIPDGPGLDLRTATPDDIAELTTARVDRLEDALKAAGLHISQMREHPSWDARDRAAATV